MEVHVCMYVYMYVSPHVTWEKMKVGQPVLVVPDWLKKKKENKKKKKALRCERIISVLPQENHGKKTISLISARLINILPNV